MRAYGWTGEQLRLYKEYRDREVFDLLGNFDKSVSEAMDYLGADLERFLKEADATIPDGMFKKQDASVSSDAKSGSDKKSQKPLTLIDFGLSPFEGVAELFGAMFGSLSSWSSLLGLDKPAQKDNSSSIIKDCQTSAASVMYQCFKNYKKAHRMISW
jgi:hypothetical protein